MGLINITYLDVKFPKYSYTLKELVDDIFREKLDDEVRCFANKTGIDRVYKSYDLRKITSKSQYLSPKIKLNDMYAKIAEEALLASKRKPSDIGLLTMLNGNQQYLMPAPTVEMVSRLGLNKDIRTQNIQGLACSSFSEALRSAAGHFALGLEGDALVLESQYSTEWYLNIIRNIDRISITNKEDFYAFVYFLTFSDVIGVAIISKTDDNALVKIDTKTIFSRKDTGKDNYKKAKVELGSDKKNQMQFNFNLNPAVLKKSVTELSLENISQLQKEFPTEFENVKSWGFHTAGLSFVDHVRERCGIDMEKAKLTYDLMRETGNTGTVSSLQLIKESLERKILMEGDVGGIVDYGWEGCDSFLYNVQ